MLIYVQQEGESINIIESKQYQKDYKKIIISKNLHREAEKIENIKSIIYNCENMHTLITNPISKLYYIEKKSGNLKEYYTARLNNKIRLIMKPIATYPYNLIEITEIEFVNINNDQYKQG